MTTTNGVASWSYCSCSGRRALQFLGLDEEQSANGFDESSTRREIPVVIMSPEIILVRIDRYLEDGAEDSETCQMWARLRD
ncbi:hypothetical protein CUMW_242500 [Citrus unshiu]|uniref:Uncharacterized protein n=1 Tax=Citrus unshiu TaxID=55188 RepID=A0A2H5QLX1_CITUN|nr:hypothetical protein CUMW_242500 [Citrus unshiu]